MTIKTVILKVEPPKHPAHMEPLISPEKLAHFRKREQTRIWLDGKFHYPNGRIIVS